ncbi:MAG: hypothetical protein K6E53_05030, partial [Lachnospiraceae bacterium]|nr:hypothetical protein [Lachnospiraceae bacterium]
VLLKVELQEGYELTNAYGQENQSYPFTKDESGNYYITVPRGGGIFISVETALKPVDPDDPVDPDQPVNPVVKVEVVDDESSSNNSSNNNGNPNFCAAVAQMIANAAYGANVDVMTITETGLDRTVIDALRARPDVSLTITFMINDVMYRVTIPAGADLSSLLDAAGGINFVSLAAYFNATPV